MFNETLNNLKNKTMLEKKYWILMVGSSHACYLELKNIDENRSHEDTCMIIKKFATVPD